MVKRKPNIASKKPSPFSKLTPIKRLLLYLLVGLLIVIVLAALIAVAHFQHEAAIKRQQQQAAINAQQQRFDSIKQVQQSFEANVRQALGTSLTDMKEYDSCYHLAQSEFHFSGPNGVLYCGMEIQGAANELPNVAASGHGAWDTSLVIAGAAKAALQQSGLAFTPPVSENKPGMNDHVSYLDIYNVYGDNVRCDLSVVNQYVGIKAGQLKFSFNCNQQASKNFFQFVPSPLDN